MSPKQRHKPIDPLTLAEFEALLGLLPVDTATGARNRALLALMFGAGLRVSEALAVRPADLDLGAARVTVQAGKDTTGGAGKRRTVAILRDTLPELVRWAELRKALGLNGRGPWLATITAGKVNRPALGDLVDTKPGRPLSAAYVRGFLARLAKDAEASLGWGKRIHAHGFRHSHALALRQAGASLETIQTQLGHTSLDQTRVYLSTLDAGSAGLEVDSIGLRPELAGDAGGAEPRASLTRPQLLAALSALGVPAERVAALDAAGLEVALRVLLTGGRP